MYFRAGRCHRALHFLFSSDFLSSLCFPTCFLTAKIASTGNSRKNAFSLMNCAWPWMRTKLCECFYRLVTFLFSMCVCMIVRSSSSVCIVQVRCLHCLEFMLPFVEMQFEYSDNQGLSIVLQPNIMILYNNHLFLWIVVLLLQTITRLHGCLRLLTQCAALVSVSKV